MTTHVDSMSPKALQALQGARHLRARASRSPRNLKQRLRGPVVGFVSGILLAFGAAACLFLDWAPSQEGRWLAAYVLVGGGLVALASVAGLGVILWGAYVQQYVDALEARGDAAETLDQVVSLVQELQRTELRQEIERKALDATRGSHPETREEICREVVEVTTEIASHRVEQCLARLEEGLGPARSSA